MNSTVISIVRGFESEPYHGADTDEAYAYLREIDDEIFNAYKKYMLVAVI